MAKRIIKSRECYGKEVFKFALSVDEATGLMDAFMKSIEIAELEHGNYGRVTMSFNPSKGSGMAISPRGQESSKSTDELMEDGFKFVLPLHTALEILTGFNECIELAQQQYGFNSCVVMECNPSEGQIILLPDELESRGLIMTEKRMNFRMKYSNYSIPSVEAAIMMLLDEKGISIDPKCFVCSCLNALFDWGIINEDDFERLCNSFEARPDERLN